MQKSHGNPKRRRINISCGRWFSKIIRERLQIPRIHSETGIHRQERTSAENLKAIGKRFNLKKQKITKESIRIFGLFKETIYRHHIEPRLQLYVPKEESFPIPLKYIHVIRSTNTDLDVAQEKQFDDRWNVDGNRNLSV